MIVELVIAVSSATLITYFAQHVNNDFYYAIALLHNSRLAESALTNMSPMWFIN